MSKAKKQYSGHGGIKRWKIKKTIIDRILETEW